jgi:hypothetical protein
MSVLAIRYDLSENLFLDEPSCIGYILAMPYFTGFTGGWLDR